MAEFTKATPYMSDEESMKDLLDASYWDPIVRGLHRTGSGFVQTINMLGEEMGVLPKGTTEHETKVSREEIQDLRDATSAASDLTGSELVEGGTMLAPLVAVPFGGSIPAAVGYGSASGLGFFEDEPTFKNKAIPAAIGGTVGLLGKGIQGLFKGPAKGDAQAHILGMEERWKTPNAPKGGMVPQPGGRPAALANAQRMGPPNPPMGPPRPQMGPPRPGIIKPQPMQRLEPARVGPHLPQMGPPKPRPVNQGMAAAPAQSAVKGGAEATGVSNATPVLSRAIHSKNKLALKNTTTFLKSSKARLAEMQTKLDKMIPKSGKKLSKAKQTEVAKLGKQMKTLSTQRGIALAAERALQKKVNGAMKARSTQMAEKRVEDQVAFNVKKAEKAEISKKRKLTGMINKHKKLTETTKTIGKKTNADIVNEIKKLNANFNPAGLKKEKLVAAYKKEVSKAKKALTKEIKANTPKTGLSMAEKGIVGGALLGAAGAASADDGGPGAGAAVGMLVAGGLGLLALRGGAGALRGMSNTMNKSFKNTPKGKAINEQAQAGMRDANISAERALAQVSTPKKMVAVGKDGLARVWTSIKETADKYAGAVDLRLQMLSPSVAAKLTNMEFRVHQISGDWMAKGDVAFKALKAAGLKGGDLDQFSVYMMQNRAKGIQYLRSKGKHAAADEFEKVGKVLDDGIDYLQSVGLGKGMQKGKYFPRQVDDFETFSGVPEVQNYFEQLTRKKGVPVTEFEKESILTDLLNEAISHKKDVHFARAAQALKKRRNRVTMDNVHAYAPLHQSFNNYAEEIVKQVERRKFFDGVGVDASKLGAHAENMDSVAQTIARQLGDGPDQLTTAQAGEIAELLKSRFGPGEQAPSRLVQNFKNYTYAGLLANPMSALTQVGDVTLSMYKNGIRNTTMAVFEQLARRGPNGMSKEALLGIRDVATDFSSKVASRDILDKALTAGGFKAMDRFGKNVFIKAAMKNNQKLDKDAFFKKWQERFDPDGGTKNTEKAFRDTQNFEATGLTAQNREDIGLMMWNELSGTQPIGLSAMPQAYLNNPTGRTMYMMQSFTLRLLNTMRKDIRNEFLKGNYKVAAKNSAKLGTLFVAGNGSVDQFKAFLLGRDEALSDTLINNLIKMSGGSKFMVDTASRQGLGAAAAGIIMPPMAIADAILDPKKAVGLIPVVGRNASQFMQ